MRLWHLPAIWTVLLDFLAWLLIHVSLSIITQSLPNRFFIRDGALYRGRFWEQNGQFWQKHLRVRRWKRFLPDGAAIFKNGYRKKNLNNSSKENLSAFIRESRRAELTHWLCMPFALVFFFWNPPVAGGIMILYAILANLPCVITQRFNRPRFQQTLQHMLSREANGQTTEKSGSAAGQLL